MELFAQFWRKNSEKFSLLGSPLIYTLSMRSNVTITV